MLKPSRTCNNSTSHLGSFTTALLNRCILLDKKHNFAKKGQDAATAAWENAKEFNERHGVADKVRAFALLCLTRFAKLIKDVSGRLLENAPNQQQPDARIPQMSATCY